MNIIKEIADKYQPLFDLMSEEYGLILTISEMDDIIAKVDEVKQLFIPDVGSNEVKCCSCDYPIVRNDGNIDYCGNCGDDLE